MTEEVLSAAAQVAPEIRRITAREFLAMAKADRPRLLDSKTVNVAINPELTMDITVKQLTKNQTSILNQKVIASMPSVPYVDETYTTINKDPETGMIRKPGTYKVQNPDDPTYKEQLEVWFNDACIWLALISASEDLGVTTENAEQRYDEIGDELPSTALLQLAIEAARVNKGLTISDQLLHQIEVNEAIAAHMAARRRLQEESDALEAAMAAEEMNEASESLLDPEVDRLLKESSEDTSPLKNMSEPGALETLREELAVEDVPPADPTFHPGQPRPEFLDLPLER